VVEGVGAVENHVPNAWVSLGLWLVLVVFCAAIVRRALFAFLLGVLVTAAWVGYCMYYQGLLEMGGILHALFGGVYCVLASHFIHWLRSRFHGPGAGNESR
jgi:hypothetical protein